MKKLILVLFIVSLGLSAFAQNWDKVEIDSAVSIKLPKGFKKTEKTGEESFSAQTSFGTILIFKADDDAKVTPDIEKDKHLNTFYDKYITRVKNSSKDGKITHEKDSVLGELKVKDFTLEIDSGSGTQLRKFRLLHANNATYTFEFLFQEIHKEYAAEECNQFFNSISVNDTLHRSDQFTDESIPATSNNRIYIVGAGIILVGLLLFFVLRNKKKKTT
ncbi:MAG: LPXTG cell wall anchor domain-containing protein [Daejeonella sp.]